MDEGTTDNNAGRMNVSDAALEAELHREMMPDVLRDLQARYLDSEESTEFIIDWFSHWSTDNLIDAMREKQPDLYRARVGCIDQKIHLGQELGEKRAGVLINDFQHELGVARKGGRERALSLDESAGQVISKIKERPSNRDIGYVAWGDLFGYHLALKDLANEFSKAGVK